MLPSVFTKEPDFSELSNQEFDWMYSVYRNVHELIPSDIPEPLENPVVTITYCDANLYHDLLTERLVMGILYLLNLTPMDYFSKKESTAETVTYGLEFVTTRTAVEQIMDLRLTLRYLGVPIKHVSYIFDNNKSVVDSSTIPHAKLYKRYMALSFHQVRETISSGMLSFGFIDGIINLEDILSKY